MTDSFPLTTTTIIDPDTHYWTPQVQRAFLEALAVEGSVRRACQTAGKSWRTAYALRMQGRGAAFALGWDGAVLIARARLADELMERAIEGQEESMTRSGDTITRHKHDNRLAMSLNSRTWRVLEMYRRGRLRAGLSGLNVTAVQAAVRRRRVHRAVPAAVREQPPGVNVSGYLDAESGMGEAARASIRSIEAAGLPVALNNVPSLLRTGDDSYRAAFRADNPQPFNLVHLNADNMPAFAAARGRRYFRGRYTIGYWFWELSSLRPDWSPFAGYVDEVWTATRFVRDAVQAGCTVPVVRVPLPVVLPSLPPLGRASFRIPEGPRMFLYIFDVSSQTERKNPIAAIRAFRRAALPHDAAVLVLKFTNPEYDRAGVRRLYEEAAGLNVVFVVVKNVQCKHN